MSVEFGREIAGDLSSGSTREWLVTNGLGGYACGTVGGVPTRRYHGLLVAATRPPAQRKMLVTKFDETITYDENVYELGANRWADGTIAPEGFRFIQRFRLDGTAPVWTYDTGDALIEKRVWMERGENTTYVTYTVLRATQPLELRVKAFVDYRDHHALTKAGTWRMRVDRIADGLRIQPLPDSDPFFILSNAEIGRDTHDWYHGLRLARETERGLDDLTDHLHAGNFTANLNPGDAMTFVLTTGQRRSLDVANATERRMRWTGQLHAQFERVNGAAGNRATEDVRQLVLAADQFIVERELDGAGDKRAPSVIAGYPWFTDWGRDTMLSLPGLLLRTGRADVAASVLRAFAGFFSDGLLPNVFPDDGAPAEYNTVDGALLFIDAVHRYYVATNDRTLVKDLAPTMADVVQAYRDGTRYGIHVDPADGLIYAGAPGIALTWMDARVGDHVVTPRVGKPVEINAMWYHALVTITEFAGLIGQKAAQYSELAARAKHGFDRFWDASERYLFDVLDGPHGNDISLRPNQIFAVALDHRALERDQERAVFDACSRALLTPAGLRTLAPGSADYRGQYTGTMYERDGAYHQGTVWPWLIGPFVAAARNVGIPADVAWSYVEPVLHQMTAYGAGTLPEIASADAPFVANGCFAQAWSVASVLDAWARTR